jgi:hypothetical protein
MFVVKLKKSPKNGLLTVANNQIENRTEYLPKAELERGLYSQAEYGRLNSPVHHLAGFYVLILWRESKLKLISSLQLFFLAEIYP